MSAAQLDTKIDYQAMELARTEALQLRLKQQLKTLEGARAHSLLNLVLRYVVEAKYSDAVSIIDEYLKMKSFYPTLQIRAQSHANHAKELINAVRAKRNFPNLSQLSLAKQQEILDHAISHFEELKFSVKAIEFMVRDEAIKDIRSTVWVLRSFIYAVILIVGTAFILDFSGALGGPLWAVFSSFADSSFKVIENLF